MRKSHSVQEWLFMLWKEVLLNLVTEVGRDNQAEQIIIKLRLTGQDRSLSIMFLILNDT